MICDACQYGNEVKSSFKANNKVFIDQTLQLLHIDLFGPIRVSNLDGKRYVFVIIDDYTRSTWVLFIAHKNETLEAFLKSYKRTQNKKKGYLISKIRSDHGWEFDKFSFKNLYDENGFKYVLSTLKTP